MTNNSKFNDTIEEILSNSVYRYSSTRALLSESDKILAALEQCNLDAIKYVPARLKENMFDFFGRCGYVPIYRENQIYTSDSRLLIAKGIELIFYCQGIILGQEDEDDESTPLRSTATEGIGIS